MKKLSIGLRLTLWYLAFFALAQIVFGAGMWFILRHHLYDIVDDTLESQVEDLKSFMAAQKKDASIAKLHEEVNETYVLEHPGDYLELYADNGELLYRSTFMEAHPMRLAEPGTLSKPIFRRRWIAGRPFRFTVQNFESNGHVYTATMGVPTDDVFQTLGQFRAYLMMFAPLLFLVAAAGGYWLSRRALLPVDSLVRTAHEISGVNLDSRLPQLTTGDELQRLSDTLNEMLDRIHKAFLQITQFTADASHELRTPVSLIRTEAELALRRSRGETEYRESLRHILLEAERTTSLIEQLLSLARADSGKETLHMQAVDLGDLLRDVVESWRQVADMCALDFSASVGESPIVKGDASALRRLADILLDNAFKYTPSPGKVSLLLESQAELVVMAVKDSGPGISAEEQSKIFERFYRIDKARSREQGGAGLGLSIAKWIVAQHQGSITVESHHGQGSIFRVQLPLIAAPEKNPLPARG